MNREDAKGAKEEQEENKLISSRINKEKKLWLHFLLLMGF